MTENYFSELNKIDVSEKIERKNGLSFLAWAYAWGELKKLHPTATYTIYKNKDGWIYHTDGKTCWVETGVTVDGLEHVEYLPVMDFKNKSIPADVVTSFDVNTAIQRSLTKAVARHGLGLYVYAGEDLPEGVEKVEEPIDKAYSATISALLEETGTDKDKFFKYFGVAKVEDMTATQGLKALKMLKKKQEGANAK